MAGETGNTETTLMEFEAEQLGDSSDWDEVSEETELQAEGEESAEEVKADSEEESEKEEVKEEEESEEPKEEKEELKADDNKEEEVKEESAKEEEEVEVKVDGKVQKVTLQELKNNYSGKVAYDKKFTEMDQERQAFKQEVNEINEYVNDLGKTMQESSVLEGFYKVGELVNMAPHQIKAALIKEILPEIARLEGLSEQEVNLEYQQSETKYQQTKIESDKKAFEAKQAQAELSKKVLDAQEALNINDKEWDEAVAYLDKTLPPTEALTVDVVKEYVQFTKAEELATSVITEFDKSFLTNEAVMGNLQNIIVDNPDFTEKDLQDIMAEAFGNSKKEVVEQKIVNSIAKKQGNVSNDSEESSGPTPIQDSEGNEILDWDDLF